MTFVMRMQTAQVQFQKNVIATYNWSRKLQEDSR
jgi:hypothetical protein